MLNDTPQYTAEAFVLLLDAVAASIAEIDQTPNRETLTADEFLVRLSGRLDAGIEYREPSDLQEMEARELHNLVSQAVRMYQAGSP